MDVQNILISACITVFSIGLFGISLLSYNKSKNKKLLFVSIVFLIFIIKGIVSSIALFNSEYSSFLSFTYTGFFDLIILVLLFMATLKR